MHINTIKIRYNDDTLNTEFTRVRNHAPIPASEVLEHIFGEWNNGSGKECSRFLQAGVRSLSVGDYVAVDGLWYRCEGIGWAEKTKDKVDKWFNTLAEVRVQRSVGMTERDEIIAKWRDRRKTEEILGIYS